MKRCVIFILFFSYIPLVTFCELKTAKYAGEFLTIGVGARPLGMGGAYVAAAEDVTAIYWNPAGLASMTTLQIHAMHSERFAGLVNWDFLGIGIPLGGNGALGFGFFRMGIDGIPFTKLSDPSRGLGEIYIDASGNRIQNDVYTARSVNDNEMAFVFSFAKRKSSRFSYGGNLRLIRKVMGDYDAWGLGFDFGVLAQPSRSLRIGLMVVDGTSTIVAWSTGRKEIIMPQVRAGLAYSFQWSKIKLLPVFDVHVGFENRGPSAQLSLGRADVDFHGGLEVVYGERVALRVGSDRGHFSAGAGFSLAFVNIDYGFAYHIDLGNSHRISATLSWDRHRFFPF